MTLSSCPSRTASNCPVPASQSRIVLSQPPVAQGPAIRGKRHVPDPRMSLRLPEVPRFQHPTSPPIRREYHRDSPLQRERGKPREWRERFNRLRGRIPQPDRGVLTPAGKDEAVGRKRHRTDHSSWAVPTSHRRPGILRFRHPKAESSWSAVRHWPWSGHRVRTPRMNSRQGQTRERSRVTAGWSPSLNLRRRLYEPEGLRPSSALRRRAARLVFRRAGRSLSMARLRARWLPMRTNNSRARVTAV